MSFAGGQTLRELVHQKIVDALAMAPPPFTPRDVRLPQVPGKAFAVVGMRRVGKTTFLWQVISERLAQGVPRESLLYFNFEDERLAGMSSDDLHLVLEEYYSLYPEFRDRQRVLFLFDEIQNVPGWEGFVRRLLDTELAEVFITGSSAALLSREVATSMRGRAVEVALFPFSFREYLRHHGREPETPVNRLPKATRSALQRDLHEYLRVGGFPEVQGLEPRDRYELLKSYVDVVLLRDVVERHSVSNVTALRWLIRHLLGAPGGLFSVHRFHRDLRSQGIPVSKDTLHEFIGYLEDAFLIRQVWIDASSERKRMVNPRKVYPVDPGFIPVFDRSGHPDIGQALETVVLLELERRGAEVRYVRTPEGFEVDFLARYCDGRQELVQVSAELGDPETREHEVRALLAAAELYPQATLHLITLKPERALYIPANIQLHPAFSWLMS